MMSKIRDIKFIRHVFFILALVVFNLSIDTPDRLPDYVPEDLSINDIESFSEFFLECTLNIENALPEHDEHDSDGGTALDFKKTINPNLPSYKLLNGVYTSYAKNKFLFNLSFPQLSLIREIIQPPEFSS